MACFDCERMDSSDGSAQNSDDNRSRRIDDRALSRFILTLKALPGVGSRTIQDILVSHRAAILSACELDAREQDRCKQDTYESDACKRDMREMDAYGRETHKRDTCGLDTCESDAFEQGTYKRNTCKQDTRTRNSNELDESFARSLGNVKIIRALEEPGVSWRACATVADEALDRARHHGLMVLNPYTEAYPQRMLFNKRFPPLLFVRGDPTA